MALSDKIVSELRVFENGNMVENSVRIIYEDGVEITRISLPAKMIELDTDIASASALVKDVSAGLRTPARVNAHAAEKANVGA